MSQTLLINQIIPQKLFIFKIISNLNVNIVEPSLCQIISCITIFKNIVKDNLTILFQKTKITQFLVLALSPL